MRLLTLFILLVSWNLHAAKVKSVDKKRDRILITDDKYNNWARNDAVCVHRDKRKIACGKVIAIPMKGAIVQLAPHTAPIRRGDKVKRLKVKKKVAATSNEAISDQMEDDVKAGQHIYNIDIGLDYSLDFNYIITHFYWAVAPKIAIGVRAGYIKRSPTLIDAKLSGFGALLTASYFSEEYFRGLWLMLGSGYYAVTLTNAGTEEKLNAPMVQFTVGWREDWAFGLNIGVAIGLRYLGGTEGTVTEVDYSSLTGILLGEVGWSF